MYILSQNKLKLVPVGAVSITFDNHIIIENGASVAHVVGRYRTEAYAKEVIRYIANAIENNDTVYNMPEIVS